MVNKTEAVRHLIKKLYDCIKAKLQKQKETNAEDSNHNHLSWK